MARPSKNNCEYFPHMANMRSHRKVKMLRNKFGQVLGYAFWSMFVEYLTDADGNEIENSEIEVEMFSSELGATSTEVREMIDYSIKIELLFIKNGFLYSESLNENLAPVWGKRQRAKEISATQKRRQDGKFHQETVSNGITVTETTVNTVITVAEMPQTKLDKTKLDNQVLFKTEIVYSEQQLNKFKKFEEWLLENAPRVQKLREPFTPKTYESCLSNFLKKRNNDELRAKEDLKTILVNMHNKATLLKEYVDASLTAQSWLNQQIKRELNSNTSFQKPVEVQRKVKDL